jgi:hypothetical protein
MKGHTLHSRVMQSYHNGKKVCEQMQPHKQQILEGPSWDCNAGTAQSCQHATRSQTVFNQVLISDPGILDDALTKAWETLGVPTSGDPSWHQRCPSTVQPPADATM